MCNEIARFTLALIELFVYAVENSLYTLAKVGFQFLQPLSSPYCPGSQLLHVNYGRIIPFLVRQIAEAKHRRRETTRRVTNQKKGTNSHGTNTVGLPIRISELLRINGNTRIIMQIKVNQSHWKTSVQSN